MADNTSDTDRIDCHDLRRDQEARWNRAASSGSGLGVIALHGSWRSALRLIEPDGTVTEVPIEPDIPDHDGAAEAAAEKEAAAQAKARAEEEARLKAEAEEEARAQAEAAAKAAADQKAKAEAEAAAKAAADQKAKAEAEAKAKKEAEERAKETARREALEKKRLEEEAKAAAEEQARIEAEAKAAALARKKAAEEKAKREAEEEARKEAEEKARKEAEAKAAAEKKAKEEAERKAKEEAEKKAKAEAEKKAREEEKARKEAEAKAAAEKKAKEEAEAAAKAAAERKAKEEAEAKAKAAAEKKAKEEAKAKAEAEQKAKEEAEAKAAAEKKAKEEAEAAAKAAAEEKARKEAEEKALAAAKKQDLGKVFRRLIKETGPISLAQFMAESNARYYTTRDPLGEEADFITAPEISQMFGELVGLWFADVWVRMGARKRIHFVELGPGRGTLAKDALRTAAKYDFNPIVHFVETSPTLRKLQSEAFPDAQHHDDLSTLPDDAPLLIMANEFFDALPIHQLIRSAQGWHERMVGLEDDKFAFVAGDKPMDSIVPRSWASAPQGTMIETSAAASAVMAEIAQRLKEQGGAALIIDYGAFELRAGSTLQAIKAHEKVDPFDYPGEADLTAHVDFEMLKDVAEKNGADVMGVQMQGEWLHQMGINLRYEALQQKNPHEKDKLKRQYDRLTADSQMGTLFKVLGVCGRRWPIGVGFD